MSHADIELLSSWGENVTFKKEKIWEAFRGIAFWITFEAVVISVFAMSGFLGKRPKYLHTHPYSLNGTQKSISSKFKKTKPHTTNFSRTSKYIPGHFFHTFFQVWK
jgi:hypothetical protein